MCIRDSYMVKRVQFGLTYINDNTQAVIANPKPRGEYFMINLNRILGASTLPSVNFVVAYNGNGTWTFTSYGRGHGVGMSQYGAYGYATREGWNYQQILAHYFPGTVLTLSLIHI